MHEDLADTFPGSFAFQRWETPPTVDLDGPRGKVVVAEAGAGDNVDRLAFLRIVARGVGVMGGGRLLVRYGRLADCNVTPDPEEGVPS